MNIEEQVLNIYIKNMQFLEREHPLLHKKIKLFETAIEMDEYKARYELEFKENYFDIYDKKEERYYYNENSYKYSKEKIKNVSFSSNSNTFKTFYEREYNDSVVDFIKNASITSNVDIGNAAISHYIQKNIPKKSEMKNIYKCFVFGIGLGIHVDLLHKKITAKKYLLIEPSLEIFRLSLFITDYENIAKSSDVHFAVALGEEDFHNFISVLSDETFLYDQYIKFFMFSQNCEMYVNTIQNFLVSQRHILYSYDRSIESFNRTYKYMAEEFNYLRLKDVQLFNKPVLLLTAGPSLSQNIDFVKKNKDKYIIVSIYVLLPYLEDQGIIPDIVTQYDQQDENVMKTMEDVKNKSLFDNTIFLFASHIVDKLMYTFPKNKIYIFQALYNVKEDYGKITSPSIGEITYGLLFHMGIKEVYLLGLDMALGKSGETHVDNHVESDSFDGMSERSNENISFRKSIVKVKGNFVDEVDTLPLFKVSILAMNDMLQYLSLKNAKVYNLSNGAYFNNTIPLKIEDIKVNDLENINKEDLHSELIEKLNSTSTNYLTVEDKEYNLKKLDDAKILYEEVKKFHSIKYSNIEIFKKSIFQLFNDLIYKECKCSDLQDIILNFYKHNLPYIFHFFNLREIDNPKKHIKQLNKLLFNQTQKIFNEYLNSVKSIDKKT